MIDNNGFFSVLNLLELIVQRHVINKIKHRILKNTTNIINKIDNS